MGGGAIFKDVTKSVPNVVHRVHPPHQVPSSIPPHTHAGGANYAKWHLGSVKADGTILQG